ncbi:MAG: hypothetical protein JWQ16_3472 [Novosphingobium sp.]|nr:hypothetical protein [Novosphingobium sp.]
MLEFFALWGRDVSSDQVRKVSREARKRLEASGAWETEEEAEREVRRRTRFGSSMAA